MAIQEVIKKIDRYLRKDDVEPLIVDVQNGEDLDAIMLHYKLPQNVFLCVSDTEFCKTDEFPIISNILERLSNENRNFFVSEISSFFMLKGEKALVQELKELLSMSIAGHAVILTFQCAEYLRTLIKNDRRLDRRVCILDGVQSVRPRLIFTKADIKLTGASTVIKGLQGIAKAVESATVEVLYIETQKSKDNYPFSLYAISDLKNPYEVLCHLDGMTSGLAESYGSKEEWQYALAEFQKHSSWQQLISAKIGSINNLDIVISAYQQNSVDSKWFWLYFIALKLFHAGDDLYLNKAIEEASSPSELVHNLYRTILEIEPTDSTFISIYERRKAHLNAIGNPLDEVNNFCKIVQSKGKYALYYLTDNTIQEKELIFKLLDRYSEDFERAELFNILERIYPDLRAYLTQYRFKNQLLDSGKLQVEFEQP